MTCDQFTTATRQELMEAFGISWAEAGEMISDAERMDELHGDLLTPYQAARELMTDAALAIAAAEPTP